MKFEKTPETFFVQEIMQPELDEGKFHYYIMKKTGIDSTNAIKKLEKENNTRIYSSGMKDAQATTEQWICSETELSENSEKRIELEFMGRGRKGIFIGMHTGNNFKVILTDVSPQDREFLKKKLRKTVFPNYFDEQRFSTKTIALAKQIASENWENALKTALTEYEEFESDNSKKIKSEIKKNWGKWKKLIESEIIPPAKKPVFEFLEKEEDYKEALKLAEPRTIKLACRAVQSLQFNEGLKQQIAKQKTKNQKNIEIAGNGFPVFFSKKGVKRELKIGPVFPAKTIMIRKTFFQPKNLKTKFFDGKCELKFELRKGCYATILLKCIVLY